MSDQRTQDGPTKEAVLKFLQAAAHDAGNYDGGTNPHCDQCAHDEAAILDATDELAANWNRLVAQDGQAVSQDAERLVLKLRAARSILHEKYGVPISAEYAQFLEAIGELEDFVSGHAPQEGKEATK